MFYGKMKEKDQKEEVEQIFICRITYDHHQTIIDS